MKDCSDIISRFDDIQDLPVSEEMLGAYLEGNLGGADLRDVQNLLNSDDNLFQLVYTLNDIDKAIDSFISSQQSGVETSALNVSEINQFAATTTNILNDSCFTLNNGDSIFDIDFGLFDISEHHDVPSHGHDQMTEIGSHDFDQLGHHSDDILTNP